MVGIETGDFLSCPTATQQIVPLMGRTIREIHF